VSAGVLPELPCADLVEVVTDYLEGDLGAVDRERFDAHLLECTGLCRVRRADPRDGQGAA
jgi:hypothetical protein